jgi:hypothetical protein
VSLFILRKIWRKTSTEAPSLLEAPSATHMICWFIARVVRYSSVYAAEPPSCAAGTERSWQPT